jgi:hypothetical protein
MAGPLYRKVTMMPASIDTVGEIMLGTEKQIARPSFTKGRQPYLREPCLTCERKGAII